MTNLDLTAYSPIPPHLFYGTAKMDGANAPDGTTVAALIDAGVVATTTTTGGSYNFQVVQPAGASFAGQTVTFTIGTFTATQTATWTSAEVTNLNLTAYSYEAGTIVGTVRLQGRDSAWAPVSVTDAAGTSTWVVATQDSGAFTVSGLPPGTYTVTASMPGYLLAQRTSVTVTAGQTTDVGTVTLLSGDLNGDGVINIFDLAMIGLNFGKSESAWP